MVGLLLRLTHAGYALTLLPLVGGGMLFFAMFAFSKFAPLCFGIGKKGNKAGSGGVEAFREQPNPLFVEN